MSEVIRVAGDAPNDENPIALSGRGATELAAVLGAAALLAVVITFPFVTQMGHVGRVDNFDGQFGIWNVSWVARTLIVDPAGVFDANIFYPHKRALAFSETNLGAGTLAIPAYWITRNPYFTFNFVLLLSLVAGTASAYYLVRYLVNDRGAAAIAGIAFGFCPYVFGRTPQMHLLWTAGLPLTMLAFHRTIDQPTNRRAAVLGLVLAAQLLFCGYYAVFSVVMLGFATAFAAATHRLWRDARYWKAGGVAGAVAIAAALPVLVPYLQLIELGYTRTLADADRYSADWRAYFASSAIAHRWMLPLLARWKEVLFPGFIALIGGSAGMVLGWRCGGRLREVAVLYGAMGGFAFWASFGPQAGLYTVLYNVLPGFTLMRAPSRFGILVTLALAVLTGVAARTVLVRVSRPVAAAAILALATAAELVVPLRFREVPPTAPAYRLLARSPAGRVIELPFWATNRDRFGHARYMLNSTAHWMPLINGYSDYVPPDVNATAPVLRSFPSNEALRLLEPHQPRYAIFHMNLFSAEERAEVSARLVEFAPYLAPLYVNSRDDVRLYEIAFPR